MSQGETYVPGGNTVALAVSRPVGDAVTGVADGAVAIALEFVAEAGGAGSGNCADDDFSWAVASVIHATVTISPKARLNIGVFIAPNLIRPLDLTY
jgi:hypothetical protein